MTVALPKPETDTQAEFKQYVMNTYGRFPLVLDRGQGCVVWDKSETPYLDFVAGIATCTLGHAHPAMIQVVTEQIQTLHHVSNLYYLEPQAKLAKWLVHNSCADKVFFCNSGAEANEAAIKLARKYAHVKLGIDHPVILTAHASFHGRTLATITATGQPKYQKDFSPLVSGFDYVPYNDLPALKTALDQYQGQVCAILLEPIQGEGGVRPGDRDYFQTVSQICNDRQILLILDEVQAGMGRTGKLWGYENLGIEPDVFTSAKGLGGGIPIGAMLCKNSCDVFAPGDHASTYGGNPFACAVALKVCETLVKENLIANARERGAQLHKGLTHLVHKFPQAIEQVRGWGLMQGLVIQAEFPLESRSIVQKAMEKGLLLVPAGTKVVRLVPPLIVSAPEIDRAVELIDQSLQELLN